MLENIDSRIIKADPFVYRINLQDYIALTEKLIRNKKLFSEINKAKESKQEALDKKYASILNRWKDRPNGEFNKMYEDFEAYKYYYKEVGASLKFNPLSEKKSAVHVLERILELLKKYITLISPKAVYTFVDAEQDDKGLLVKGSTIHFNSTKLKIFTNHSSIKSEQEISPQELAGEKVVVYVVTIGSGIDAEVKSISDKGDLFEAYVLNGIGSGAAEMAANDLNLFMNDNYHKSNCSYKRLSPGYGDWPITDQEKIFKLLNPEKNIGVKLTDSHIMIPEKSTSGIMGLISV